jgi:hypothetical protein
VNAIPLGNACQYQTPPDADGQQCESLSRPSAVINQMPDAIKCCPGVVDRRQRVWRSGLGGIPGLSSMKDVNVLRLRHVFIKIGQQRTCRRQRSFLSASMATELCCSTRHGALVTPDIEYPA